MKLDPYISLLSFVKADSQAHELKITCSILEKKRTQAQKEAVALETAYQELVQHHSTLKKQFDALEHEIRSQKDRRDHLKHARDRTNNPKEFVSIQQEIALVIAKIDGLEDTLINLLEQVDKAEQDVKKAQPAYINQSQKIAGIIAQCDQEFTQCTANQQAAEFDAAGRRGSVKTDWLHAYDAMKASVPNPMVPVHQNICSGCFQHVSSQDLIALDRHELIRCRSCYRFLYR